MFPYQTGLSGPTKAKVAKAKQSWRLRLHRARFPRIFANLIFRFIHANVPPNLLHSVPFTHIIHPHGRQWVTSHKTFLECVGLGPQPCIIRFFLILILTLTLSLAAPDVADRKSSVREHSRVTVAISEN